MYPEGAIPVFFSALPFLLTFFVVSTVVLQKVFPLLSGQQATKGHGSPTTLRHRFSSWSPKALTRLSPKQIVAFVFSATIALAAVLAELLLCEISNTLSPIARTLALQFTVTCLLLLLIVAIPLLEIHSVISTAGWNFAGPDVGRLRLAWVLGASAFGGWMVIFWWIGQRLPGTHNASTGTQSREGIVEACLERVGIIGISLMALLSGFASVSSLWQTFGVKPRPVTESDIARKQAGLDATEDMLSAKRSRLRAVEMKISNTPNEGFFQKAIGSLRGNADTQERQSLRLEVSGLETMSMSLSSSLSLLRNRRSMQLRRTTPTGRMLLFWSYIFSLYCLSRILTTSISLVRRQIGPKNANTTDPINYVLSLLIKHYDPSLNRLVLAQHLSFLLSGLILFASFSAVLQTFQFFARFTPSILYTAQANLALVISQICGMYVISSALLLRNMMPKEVGGVISNALGLGSGEVLEGEWVGRWFEGWFLCAVAVTGLGIWVSRKIGGIGDWEDDTWEGDVEMGKRS